MTDDPLLNLKLNFPDRAPRDQAMGEYMDAWSRLEGFLRMCVREMLEIDEFRANAVFAAISTRQTIELLLSMARATLTEDGVAKVKAQMEGLGKVNRRRNSIVHGYWVCAFDGAGQGKWIRKYTPIDVAKATLPTDHPDMAGTYAFTVPQLQQATSDITPALDALGVLFEELPGLRLKSLEAEPHA